MALKDRFRRLRNRSSPPTSTSKPPATSSTNPPAIPTTSSPANISPGTRSTTASTGQATPAATQTPIPANSSADLTTTTSSDVTTTATNPLTSASTIQEVLSARAATNASLAASNGEKKKRRGLFRRKEDPYKDWPEDVYKPHEVPAPKYRRTPDPKHLENLHAFSFGAGAGGGAGGMGGGFGKLVRRFSQQSGVSPGGSKWQSPFASRAGSRVGSRAPSRLASAAPSADTSRNPSIAEDGEELKGGAGVGSPGKLARPSPGARGVSTKSLGRGIVMQAHDVGRVAEEEGEGEGDVGDGDGALMSRQRTVREDDGEAEERANQKTDSKGSHDMPFTEQELTQALTKVTLSNSGPKVVETPPS